MKEGKLNETKNRMIHVHQSESLQKHARKHHAEPDQTVQDWVVVTLGKEID
jgi:hypothetical protein